MSPSPAFPVLVTGGEGLVGRAVVARLLDAGHPVTTLSPPGADPHPGVRVVRGDARDPDAVREAVAGVVAVAHLAALPGLTQGTATEVYGNNTLATFTVLWTAAEAGVRRFAIAGSVNATGLLMNPRHPLPDRYPVDEGTRSEIADPYSLSKAVDEVILAAVCRRFDASGVALRMPLMLSPDNAAGLREWQAARSDEGAGDGWAWLDVRDAAEAFRLALLRLEPGAEVVHLAARDTIQAAPTQELLDRHAPGVPRDRDFPDHTAPVDVSHAHDLLGWEPRHHDLGRPQ